MRNRRLMLGALSTTLGLLAFPGFVYGQYMYLDSNGDGMHTSTDQVLSALPTVVDVWITTNLNRDGSPASCPTGDGDLTISSYELVLHTVDGTVAWGAFENAMTTMTTSFGSAASPSEYYVGWGGGTILTPGNYRLGRLTIEVESGSPEIRISPTSSLSGVFGTTFGSRCSGAGGDNTLRLGTDWQDADGLAPPLLGGAIVNGNTVFSGQSAPESAPMSPAGVDSGCPQSPVACDISAKYSTLTAGPFTGVVASRDTITYFVSSPSGVKKGCLVQVTATAHLASEINTGGHCHGPNPRTLPILQPSSGNTGNDGFQFRVAHTWPDVAGRYHIFFEDAPGDTCGDFQEIFTVCVRREPSFSAGLAAFPGPGPGYELTHGPDNATRHPDHHYGTPKFNKALMDIAAAFRDSIPGVPILGYNDMSLRWGGVFDIDTDRPWLNPHRGHRNGDMCDMRTHVAGVARYTPPQLGVLKKILKDQKIRPIIHYGPPIDNDPPHWHLQPITRGYFDETE